MALNLWSSCYSPECWDYWCKPLYWVTVYVKISLNEWDQIMYWLLLEMWAAACRHQISVFLRLRSFANIHSKFTKTSQSTTSVKNQNQLGHVQAQSCGRVWFTVLKSCFPESGALCLLCSTMLPFRRIQSPALLPSGNAAIPRTYGTIEKWTVIKQWRKWKFSI